MSRVVEILQYRLKAGSGPDFHRVMQDISVPLHRRAGIDIVAYGSSLHDPDAYYLIRAYDDLADLDHSQNIFYASADWRNGPRAAIVGAIETNLKSIVALSPAAIEALRQAQM